MEPPVEAIGSGMTGRKLSRGLHQLCQGQELFFRQALLASSHEGGQVVLTASRKAGARTIP